MSCIADNILDCRRGAKIFSKGDGFSNKFRTCYRLLCCVLVTCNRERNIQVQDIVTVTAVAFTCAG